MDAGVITPQSVTDEHVFRKSDLLQSKLHELLRVLGNTAGLTCVDVGCENGKISSLLRQEGGEWHSVAPSPSAEGSMKALVGDSVYLMDGLQLPFKKKQFDIVIVMDSLEKVAADGGLIEECHRVLKPDGRLILSVTHVKSWSLADLVRRAIGLTPENRGLVRKGYTESQLFNILKNGFDVVNMRSYSRFWVQFVDAMVQFYLRRHPPLSDSDGKRLMRAYSIAGPFFALATQLDMFLFFTRGHCLIASAKRRTWRPREAPVLVDGRSISEAVLSKAAR